MNHFINILKVIGAYVCNFVSFINDSKSIVTGTYTALFLIGMIIDIAVNGGTNTGRLVMIYMIGISKL